MSTWRLTPDAGNSFRWESTSPIRREPIGDSMPPSLISDDARLPSMEDLLLQGYSKLLENPNEQDGIFVATKKSPSAYGSAGEHSRNNGRDFPGSLFQTGSGKMVNISSAGQVRAKALLGSNEDDNHLDSQGHQHTTKRSSTYEPPRQRQSSSCLEMKDGMNKYRNIDAVPISRSPSVSQTPMMESKLDNQVHFNRMQSGARDKGRSFPGSLFQTGSGEMVNISSTGLVRAKTLLGLDEDDNHFAFQGHQHTAKQSGTYEPPRQLQNSSCLEMKEGMNKYGNMIGSELDNEVHLNRKQSGARNNGGSFPGSLFQTGSGKMVNISSAGLVRAKTLLGLDEDNNHFDFQGHQHTTKQSDTLEPPRQWQDSSCLEKKDGMNKYGNVDAMPISRSPSVSQTAMMESELDNKAHLNRMQSGAGNNGGCFSGSLFQTGSGKMVNISSAGLVRAKALLGLDEDNNPFDFQGHQHTTKQSATYKPPRTSSCVEPKECMNNYGTINAASTPRSSSVSQSAMKELDNKVHLNRMKSETSCSASKPPQIKFHTAGGKSISVSSDALKCARSLLGEPELGNFLDKGNMDTPPISLFKESRFNGTFSSKNENKFRSPFSHLEATKNKSVPKMFTSPLRSSSKQVISLVKSGDIISGSNLIKRFDAVENENASLFNRDAPSTEKQPCNLPREYDKSKDNSHGPRSRTKAEPLVDITNRSVTSFPNSKQVTNQKRRFGTGFVTPFKKPRSSNFTTPLNKNVSHASTGSSTLSSEQISSRRAVSTRYPFEVPRRHVQEYFAEPPFAPRTLDHIPDKVRWMTSDSAVSYTFCDESGSIGVGDFCQMLVKCGASIQYSSKEWVTNHYKWIIWKLACYERYYPTKCAGKFLTVSNVLEELKYRYEREVNHGHRSAIKRILDGDTPPSLAMVLCVSAIRSNCESTIDTSPLTANGGNNVDTVKVELTDGWYALDASLDVALTKQLTAGKLFGGQKLRIWGAALSGWMAPVSPFEASGEVRLLLSINGTYRVHWADRLGLCKDVPAPLAFRCIKSNGGPVPSTLVGVIRIYPVLYKEMLCDGGSVVRSERLENKRLQVYSQRRESIIESIISDFQRRGCGSSLANHGENEGARIYKVLEMADEPDVLMADMSPEQLSSFATYKAKLEASRESELEKAIQKALQDAGLSEKKVTPFMRVKVVGLTGKNSQKTGYPKEGIITVWKPSEKLIRQLVEGQAYAISGLIPMDTNSEFLYLQARESTTKWHSLSPQSMQQYRPFFNPRKPVSLSNFGEVPLSSEFDVATFVVHVGEVYAASHQRKQWLFVTDGSISKFSHSLLAICFCFPYIDDDSFAPINSNLEGSTVGFCNLIKRSYDLVNHMWVADATENSTYYLSFGSPQSTHLRTAALVAQSWGQNSRMIIDKLKEKVLFIIGDSKG